MFRHRLSICLGIVFGIIIRQKSRLRTTILHVLVDMVDVPYGEM